MRTILFLCLAANCFLAQAQKKPVVTSTTSEKLRIGDTYYVTAKRLAIRGLPSNTELSDIVLTLGDKVAVQEMTDANWVIVTYYSGDVGVSGYVERKYLQKKKAVLPGQ